MKRSQGFAVIAALVATGMPAAPARADYRQDAARSACSDRIRSQYDASTRNVSASERGYDRFSVTGEARRGSETASFTCRTDRGSVQSVSVGSWRRGGSDAGKTAAAVGIAVGLAAIIAAASSKRRNDDYDRYGRRDYDRGDNGYYNNDSYSPTGGIICYRAQRSCFDDYHNYNARWTQREFDY